MMRLPKPQYTYQLTINKCIEGITGNDVLLQKITSNQSILLRSETQYLAAANSGTMYKINPINISEKDNLNVVANLTKSDLKKIYETYFRPEDKPGRVIYEHLFNLANEQCPYCGGIGVPRNLDHYLPVAHFPQFSVLPTNLVPACRDCNMDGDMDGFATCAIDQIIHPYLDHNRFFTDQWIHATYKIPSAGQPSIIEFFVKPPANWPDVDKLRAENHFRDFGLSKRYSTKSAGLKGTTVSQILAMRSNGVSECDIVHTLLTPGVHSAPFVNHWQKGLFQALIASLPKIV
jgi:hypothetical protein